MDRIRPIHWDYASIALGPVIGAGQIGKNAIQAIYQRIQIARFSRKIEKTSDLKDRAKLNVQFQEAQRKHAEHISNIGIGAIRMIPVVGGIGLAIHHAKADKLQQSDASHIIGGADQFQQFWEKAAKAGNPEALILLGNQKMKTDFRAAQKLFLQAADKDPDAYYYLSQLFREVEDLKDPHIADEYLQKAIDKGSTIAQAAHKVFESRNTLEEIKEDIVRKGTAENAPLFPSLFRLEFDKHSDKVADQLGKAIDEGKGDMQSMIGEVLFAPHVLTQELIEKIATTDSRKGFIQTILQRSGKAELLYQLGTKWGSTRGESMLEAAAQQGHIPSKQALIPLYQSIGKFNEATTLEKDLQNNTDPQAQIALADIYSKRIYQSFDPKQRMANQTIDFIDKALSNITDPTQQEYLSKLKDWSLPYKTLEDCVSAIKNPTNQNPYNDIDTLAIFAVANTTNPNGISQEMIHKTVAELLLPLSSELRKNFILSFIRNQERNDVLFQVAQSMHDSDLCAQVAGLYQDGTLQPSGTDAHAEANRWNQEALKMAT